MATQHSKKLKKTAPGKARPVKAAASKKPVKKAPVKAKATSKPKSIAKPVKAKKAAVAKKKPVAKASKPAKAMRPKAKSTVVSKAKPVVKKPVQVKAVVKAVVKAGKAPKSGARTKSSKSVAKVIAPKQPAVKQATGAAKKLVTIAGGTKPKNKEVIKLVAAAKTSPVISKSTVTPMIKSGAGSKATDHTKKPSVGTSGQSTKPNLIYKPKPFVHTPSKHITESKMKPFEKMTEKKEFRPYTMAATAEEPQKSRYSDKELEEFDQLIDQKLIVAREQLEFYLKQLEDMAENPDNKIKGLDDGLSTLESERVSSLASRQQKLIQHLENAKIRIKNKVYGICRETGKLISKERLRAVPHATLSIEAKQAQN